MPCDSIETTEVDFKSASPDFVRRALQSLGYEVTENNGALTGDKDWAESVIFVDGSLEIRTRSGVDAATITRAYSAEIIKFAAEEYGWQFEQTGENEYAIQKETF